MKKTFYTFLIFSFLSLNINSQTQYSSIDDVKRLNYELFEEIGFDDSKINIVSRFVSNLRSLYVISENNLAIEIPISNVRFDKLSIKFDGIKEDMFAETVDEKNVIMIVMYIFRWRIFTLFSIFNKSIINIYI